VLVAAGACSSSAIDDAGDAGDDVSEEIDESADQVDEATGDLAAVFEDNGLENLASAVEEIDIAEVVGTEDFTFFAPDDEAFQSLDAEDIAVILSDPEQLDDVLRRHVVAERIDAAALAEMSSVETEGGTTLEVSVDEDIVMIGDATVVKADIDVDNGIVHVVDRIFVDG